MACYGEAFAVDVEMGCHVVGLAPISVLFCFQLTANDVEKDILMQNLPSGCGASKNCKGGTQALSFLACRVFEPLWDKDGLQCNYRHSARP